MLLTRPLLPPPSPSLFLLPSLHLYPSDLDCTNVHPYSFANDQSVHLYYDRGSAEKSLVRQKWVVELKLYFSVFVSRHVWPFEFSLTATSTSTSGFEHVERLSKSGKGRVTVGTAGLSAKHFGCLSTMYSISTLITVIQNFLHSTLAHTFNDFGTASLTNSPFLCAFCHLRSPWTYPRDRVKIMVILSFPSLKAVGDPSQCILHFTLIVSRTRNVRHYPA